MYLVDRPKENEAMRKGNWVIQEIFEWMNKTNICKYVYTLCTCTLALVGVIINLLMTSCGRMVVMMMMMMVSKHVNSIQFQIHQEANRPWKVGLTWVSCQLFYVWYFLIKTEILTLNILSQLKPCLYWMSLSRVLLIFYFVKTVH